jgi:hypothetical protein
MAFSMPVCAKLSKLVMVSCLLTALTVSGCDRSSSENFFDLQQVDARWSNGFLQATVRQKLSLSAEAREALQHGVPLTVQMEMVIRNTSGQTRVKSKLDHYEVRYLPLSDHYQLTLPGGSEVRTFPRLRHLLADLGTVRVSLQTGALPAGSYELLTRTRMDKSSIPPSMRLPTLFSSEWRHDSDWMSSPLEIVPQA